VVPKYGSTIWPRYEVEGLSDSIESLYIVKDFTLIESVDLIVTKSEGGSIFLPIFVGSSSHEIVKNIVPARIASEMLYKILPENNLRGKKL
jgi:hypothetical protein